jgi:CTP:molybdopterin cytidylyltransferase MocA
LEHKALKDWGIVIAAGGCAGAELSETIGADSKAAALFRGEPCIRHVHRACRESGVDCVAVAGSKSALEAVVSEADRTADEGETNISTAANGIAALPGVNKLLILPCDTPLLSGEHIRSFLFDCDTRIRADTWFAAGLSSKARVMEVFPGASYTFLRFAEGQHASGGLYATSRDGFLAAREILEYASRNRKSQLGLLLRFGIWGALRYLFGRLSFADAERRAGKLLGGQAIIIPTAHPATTLDFDTVEDWHYLKSIEG